MTKMYIVLQYDVVWDSPGEDGLIDFQPVSSTYKNIL